MPPLKQCILERGGVVRGELTLEYLLLLRNSSIASCQVETNSNQNEFESASRKPIYKYIYIYILIHIQNYELSIVKTNLI